MSKSMKAILASLVFCMLLTNLWGQKFTISGYVEDLQSSEKLIAVNVFDFKSALGTVTNTYGFYSLTLPQDSVILEISYVGYKSEVYKLYLDKDVVLNIKLSDNLVLDVVEVVATEVTKIEEETQMSRVVVPIEQIKKVPALFGEVDVLKVLQLLPGVQSGGEGQSGLYVRGGGPDQNLILLDGVPVYNASHLFGFFSVFNADAIKNVTLYKGGFPARYGGRLSSIIDMTMKEGDMNDIHASGSIGLISAKLKVEGPIVKDKTSFIVSARRTYFDILLKPFIKDAFGEDQDGSFGYYFYDLNGKVNHRFSDKDRLYFSIYNGRDKFNYKLTTKGDDQDNTIGFGLEWGNVTSALRWNHLFTNKLFANTTLSYSNYNFQTSISTDNNIFDPVETEQVKLTYTNGIRDYAAKIDFDYVPSPNHFIRFGASVIAHTFKPGEFDFNVNVDNDGTDNDYQLDTLYGEGNLKAEEYAFYVEDDLKIGAFKANVGVHLSGFSVNDKFYTSVQPRLGMKYLLPSGLAIKGSFVTMRQYINLLTNEGISLPTDLWLPATKEILPQDSWQAAIGAAKTIGDRYELSAEAYYKEMTNITAYKEGSSLFDPSDWEEKITQGNGRSYGLELMIQKKIGRISGWAGYTLSWTNRKFDDINFGKTYDYKYDRRHDFAITVSYDITDRIDVSGSWVYGTGNAVTIPNSGFVGSYPGSQNANSGSALLPKFLEHYQQRNNVRMKAYHRFDWAFNFKKEKKRYTRTWSIGAYNSYNRNNPFLLQIIDNKIKQISIFPIIPFVSYSFKF